MRPRSRSLVRNAWEAIKRSAPDGVFSRLQFARHHGRLPNITRPRTFSEMILRQRLRDDSRALAPFVDKVAVRSYVAETIGDRHVIPLYDTFASGNDIDGDRLPPQFVLKANHGSGFVRIVNRHQGEPDWAALRVLVDRWLATDYGALHRERAYSHVPRIAFAERFLEAHGGTSPVDVKCFVFDGVVRLVQLDLDRHTRHTRALLTPTGETIAAAYRYPRPDGPIALPRHWNDALATAERLARPFDFVRVDLYLHEDQVWFGELTFYPLAGIGRFDPAAFDIELGGVWRDKRPVTDAWIIS